MSDCTAASDCACTIVIATFNRCRTLIGTLGRLIALPDCPEIIVVDNGSGDGTCAAVRRTFPAISLVQLPRNIGAAARNSGAALARSRYIAFCDDDCWWEAGSLTRAAALLDAHANVGLLHARVMVGGAQIDEACALMAASPIRKRTNCPGTSIGAFMACAVVVRRAAFLAGGGYHPRYHIGAEESLLALDLLDRGWELIYDARLVLVHEPETAGRVPRERRVTVQRNRLWTIWLRHSTGAAIRATAALARRALRDPESRAALVRALRGLNWVLRERRPVRPAVEHLVAQLVALPA